MADPFHSAMSLPSLSLSHSLSFDGNEIGSGTENPSSTMHKHAPYVQPNVCTCNCIGHITFVFASSYIHTIHAHFYIYKYSCLPSPSHRVTKTASYTSFPCHLPRPLQRLRVIPWRKHWLTLLVEGKKEKEALTRTIKSSSSSRVPHPQGSMYMCAYA